MSGRSDLDVVAAALGAVPPLGYGWTDGMQDLYERFLRAPDLPLPQEYRQKFERHRERERLSAATHEVWWSLEKHEEAGALSSAERAEAAELAERCVHARFLESEAVGFLHTLGRPAGEEVLLRLVRDGSVDEFVRARARELLIRLRRDADAARSRQPVEGEDVLLPAVVRELPVSRYGGGIEWTDDPGLLRRVLEALLPAERLVPQEPPAEWHSKDGDDEVDYAERPEWLDIGILEGDLMPHPSQVTRERLARLRRECELLGLGVAAEDFVERRVTRIRAGIAAGAFQHLGSLGYRRPDEVTPWAMDLAQRYVERDAAAEKAVYMLSCMSEYPYAREVLTRIAADASLRPEVRTAAEIPLG